MSDGEQVRSVAPPQQQTLSPFVAHDINGPLDALSNILHLLQTEPHLTEEGRRLLTLAQGEIQRLTSLVRESLVRFHDSAQRSETSIPRLLDEIVELYRNRFDGNGIGIETQYCNDGSLSIFPQLLRRAFSNILLNASEAIPQRGTITIRVRHAQEWSGKTRRGLRVIFADNGIGIDRDDLLRIFQPFFSTKGNGGSGMGLSIVSEAVHEHSGTLRVRSSTRAGRSGSVFAIFLPAE